MSYLRQLRSAMYRARATAVVMAVLVVLTVSTNIAHAQSYQVLYNFLGFSDGAQPYSGVTIRGTVLYGTTHSGNEGANWGDIYQLRPHGGAWIFTELHLFDGTLESRPIFGPDGSLYGTSPNNIDNMVHGYIYKLAPRLNSFCLAVRCDWNLSFPYTFGGGADGSVPRFGELVFDQAGNIYGTTSTGGNNNNGVVFELSPSQGGWTEQPIYQFTGSPDGSTPFNGVIFDSAGNLYGTTMLGGQYGFGTVFELSPSGGGWTERVLYSFQNGNDGSFPIAGLVFDQAGNLYGAASNGGSGGAGTVYQLTPSGGGNWTFNLVQSFSGASNCGPWASLTFDTAGSLYGTTYCSGANSFGNVFKLTPSGGGWTYSSIYDFTGGNDGKKPISNVSFDAAGNMYGTASGGGTGASGVVWQIAP